MKRLILILLLLLPAAAHAQSCTPNNNDSFTINGNTLSGSGLSAQQYTAGVTVNMSGVRNSGTCFPVTVTGQAVIGGIQPYGNVLCPRGCTWVNVFNDDFRVDTMLSADNTQAVTNALWYEPPDGDADPHAGGGVFACRQGALDTTHLPGYLSFHAIGTIPWETSGALTCGIYPKVSNSQTPPGCPAGAYGRSCVPLTQPTLWEYMAQEAPNQINEIAIYGGSPDGCGNLMYFGESRGNNNTNATSMWNWQWNWIGGGSPGCPGGPTTRDLASKVSSDAPHVSTLVFDPQAGWSWYWDGVYQGIKDPFGCATTQPCDGAYDASWQFDTAISPYASPFTPGGNFNLYFVRAYTASGGGGGTPTITVNGSSTGTTVNAGSTISVAVTGGWGGSGGQADRMFICAAGQPPSTGCSYGYVYLSGCQQGVPSVGATSGTCSMTAPSSAGSYQVNLYGNTTDWNVIAATAPFTVTGGGGGGGGQATADPNANAMTRRVLQYFYNISGNHALSGQYLRNDGTCINDWYHSVDCSGSRPTVASYCQGEPAIAGFDPMRDNFGGIELTQAETQWDAGGFIMEMLGDSWHGSLGDFLSNSDEEQLVTPGTPYNIAWHSGLDVQINSTFIPLQNHGAVVLYRPLHEMNGWWAWVGNLDDAHMASLWQDLFNYFTYTKGLHNILWVWSPNGSVGNYLRGYRSQYVDMVALDEYDVQPTFVNGYYEVTATGKPFGMGEVGNVSDPNTPYDYSQWPVVMNNSMPLTTFFMAWMGDDLVPPWGKNCAQMMQNPRMINLGGLHY